MKKISIYTAAAIVIANMIGTGVFTSVGFQLNAIQNSWSIISLWFFGGVLSLFGAFAYAELGTHYKESGGDYIYLSRIFHPMLGYLSAWAGLTVGFSAPVALAAMAFTQYLSPVLGLPTHTFMAIAIIVAIGLLHSFTLKHSSRLQNSSTVLKIVFIVVLIIIGVAAAAPAQNALLWNNSWHHEVVQPGYAVAMVYVAFAYTGWNAAAYVVDEMDNPRLHLPRALIGSTLFVMVVYMLFQYVLLKHATVNALKGKESVTFIAFNNVLGAKGAKWVSAFIALQLIATISSYIWVGSRVTAALAREHRLWQPFSIKNKHGIPIYAIWLHVAIAIVLLLTGSFEKVLLYAGFVLQLMASLTVATSLFTQPKPFPTYKSPFKPVLQIIFLLFNAWVLIFTLIDKPVESLIGVGILVAGLVLYAFDKPVNTVNPTN